INAVKASSLDEYYAYLKRHPDELTRLFYDVLISVTAFFRDKAQFEALQSHLRSYLENAENKTTVRIWSAGCATGEEPYSLAILALEAIKSLSNESKRTISVQVFATDI